MTQRPRAATLIVAAITTIGLLTTLLSTTTSAAEPASPDQVEQSPIDVLQAVPGVAAESATSTTVQPDGTLRATAPGLQVEVGAEPTDGVTVDPTGAGRSLTLIPRVPGDVEPTTDGALVAYQGDAGVSAVIQPTTDGIRAASVIDGPDSPSEFRYEVLIGGQPARLTPDGAGGVSIAAATGPQVAVVQPPWAVDAAGAAVPTSYRTDGATLVQVVDHTSVDAYPVVADPKVCG